MLGALGALALSALAVPAAPAAPADPEPSVPPGDSGVRTSLEAGVRLAASRAAADGIRWQECAPEERLPAPVQCGTVSVPLDYTRPHGRTLELRLSRSAADGPPAEYQGPLLYNPGGPGGSGLSFARQPERLPDGLWRELHRAYDFIGYDPRGVGRSAPISCADPREFWAGPNPSPQQPSEAFKRLMNGRAAAYAAGCEVDQGDALEHFNTPNNARDLHTIRAALGERQLNYLGVSYGSYIGSVYATLFPGTVRRMVLDSVVDPDPELIWYRSNLAQNSGFELRWRDWKEWTAQHHGTYGLGEDAEAVQSAFDIARDRADREQLGDAVGSKELHRAFLSVAYSDAAWPRLASALAAFHRGDPEALRAAAHPDPREAERRENANAVYTAVECNDAPWPRDWQRWDQDHTRQAARAPFATWENAWMNLPCAHWPLPGGTPVDVGTAPGELPPVLLLHATRDAATPYSGALETQRRLYGSALVTERGAGNHGVAGGNPCVDELLGDYLLTGASPGSRTDCEARPAPLPEDR